MYVYGSAYIYRETLLLPSRRGFSCNDIKKACKENRKCQPHVSLRDGSFKTVFSDESQQIILWKYTSHVGCSTVTSCHHGQLPNIVVRNEAVVQKMSGIGYKYMWHGLEEDSDTSKIDKVAVRRIVETNESDRKESLIRNLREHYPSFSVCYLEDHYCHFSGGGDVLMVASNLIFCLDVSSNVELWN